MKQCLRYFLYADHLEDDVEDCIDFGRLSYDDVDDVKL